MSDKVIRVPDSSGRARQDAEKLKEILGCPTIAEAVRTAVRHQLALLELEKDSSFVEIIGNNPDGPVVRFLG